MTKISVNANRAIIFLAIIAFGFVLVVGRDVIYPICIAILFSFLVYPLTKWLEEKINSRAIAALLSVLVAVIIVIGVFLFLYSQVKFLLNDSTALMQQANQNLQSLQKYIATNTPINFGPKNELSNMLQRFISSGDNQMKQVLNATTGTLVGLGLQPVYIYFMLYYRDSFRDFLFEINPPRNHERLRKILNEISQVTKNYISGIFIVVIILCFLNTLGLTIVGIKYALLFGILSALMNFMPYFGTLVGGAIPLIYALVSEEPRNALGVLLLFLIIQFTENNILTPNITGGRVAINPLFTIFIIIIGGMAWGLPGMFISVPFLGMFKVVCSHVESLKPFSHLISSSSTDDKSGWMKIKNRLRHLIKKSDD